MSRRGFVAYVRLALIRGRNGFLIGGGASLFGLFGTIVFDGPLRVFAVVVATISLAISLFTPFKPLVTDKMIGHLEFDRTLPLPLRTIAAGRLAGATARSLPVVLSIAAIGVMVADQFPGTVTRTVVVAIGVVILLYWCAIWIAYAVGARFSMRGLVWLPLAILYSKYLIPDSVGSAMESRIEELADLLFRRSDPSLSVLLLVVVGALAVAALTFSGATLVLVDALGRFRANPSAMMGPLGAVPKRELAAIGRGPILAIARLRLRLAIAELRTHMIVVAIMLVVILAELGGAAELARRYLPIVTMLLPAAVAMQLMRGRTLGTLEALQHLPHSRRVVGVGHVLAVMVMAIPAVVINVIARATDGMELGIEGVVVRWFWFVALGSFAVGCATWFTPRRTFAVLAVLILGPIAVGMLAGGVLAIVGLPSAEQFAELAASRGNIDDASYGILHVALAITTTLAGIELFNWGLATYTGQGVK